MSSGNLTIMSSWVEVCVTNCSLYLIYRSLYGTGTAGCALASRLSEDRGTTVLLLEAGERSVGPNAPSKVTIDLS